MSAPQARNGGVMAVSTHLTSVYAKLGVGTRHDLPGAL